MLNRVAQTNPITKNILSLLVVFGALLLILALAAATAGQDFTILVVLLGVAALVTVMIYWQVGIYLAFAILFVEGFARNYFDNPTILLVKDGLLILVYLRYFGERIIKREPLFPKTNWITPLIILFFISVVECFNPSITSLSVGLIGLHSEFLYVPIAFLVPDFINSQKSVSIFSWFMLLTAIPIALYGIIQLYEGPNAYYSLGPGFHSATFVVAGSSGTGIFRPSSTFSYPTQFATYLFFSLIFGVGVFFQPFSKLKILSLLVMPLLVFTVLISGQRTLYVLIPAMLIAMLLIMKQLKFVFQFLVPLILGTILVLNSTASSAFVDRLSTITQNQDNIVFAHLDADIGNTINGLTLSPIGVGTGMGTLGTQYAADKIAYFFEGYFGKTAAEIGWFGLIVFLVMLFKIGQFLIVEFGQILSTDYRWLALPLLVYTFVSYYSNFAGNTLDLAAANIFFWFSIGYVSAVKNVSQSNIELPRDYI